MSAVYKKELRAALCGTTGIIFIAYVLFILGLVSILENFYGAMGNFEYVVLDMAFFSLLAVPILTMRSFAEERHSKTDQLLYSLPLSGTQVVLGKFFAMVTVFAVPCAVMCFYPPILAIYNTGGINFIIAYGAILAYFLLGCAVIAICMLLSTLTENQVIAAIISLNALLVMFFVDILLAILPGDSRVSLAMLCVLALLLALICYRFTANPVFGCIVGGVAVLAVIILYFIDASLFDTVAAKLLGGINLFSALNSFQLSTLDLGCCIHYLSICALFVFFSVQSFERRRWS